MAKFLGIDWAPVNIPFKRRLQTLSVIWYMFVFGFSPWFCILFPIYVIVWTRFWWLMLLYFVWYLYDYQTPHRGGRFVKWFRRSPHWKNFSEYFPITLEKSEDLDASRRYIMGYHPHGIGAIGACASFGSDACKFNKLFPEIVPRLGTLEINFLFPFRREYLLAMGILPVGKPSLNYVLSRCGPGQAVVIVIGGAQEALYAKPNHFELTLKTRKGFVKLALQQGADLVPVFSFGENDIYLQMDNPKGSKLYRFQQFIKRTLTFTWPMFYGRGVFNYTFGILPMRKPINVIVGKPIRIDEKIAEPTHEQIDQYHQEYIDRLNEVFESNKGRFGIESDTHLTIM